MSEHVEAETVLQPSLHSMDEYVDMVISEAECRGVDVVKIRAEFDSRENDEFIGEMADEALSALYDAGYANVEADDTLLIYAQGVDVPQDWTE